MPTYTIYGKKGGGKTLYALMHYILPELSLGDRVICTTVALKLDELSAYCAKKWPHKNIDVNKRVRILTREEGRRFWLHRQPGVDIVDVSDKDYDNGQNPDYSAVAHLGGILYVIDEIHIDFDARAWAKVGRGLTYYNSQERKLLDDQVFITQFLSLVDKRVKDFSQEWIVCRNFRYEKFLTFLSKGSSMQARHYPAPPTTNGVDICDEKHSYKVQPEIVACYDTSQGVGFKGAGKPDTKRKTKLPPWWVIFLAVPALWFLISRGVDFLGKKAAGGTEAGKALAKAAGFTPAEPIPVSSPVSSSPFASSPQAVAKDPARDPNSTESARVTVKGYAIAGGKVNVMLSDGRVLIEADKSLPLHLWASDAVKEIRRNGVVTVGGVFYPMMSPNWAPARVVAAPRQEVNPEPVGATEYRGEGFMDISPGVATPAWGSAPANAGKAAGFQRQGGSRPVAGAK